MVLSLDELIEKRKLTRAEKVTFLCLSLTILSQSINYLRPSATDTLLSEELSGKAKRRAKK